MSVDLTDTQEFSEGVHESNIVKMVHLKDDHFLICFRDFHFSKAKISDQEYTLLDEYSHAMDSDQNQELLDADAI